MATGNWTRALWVYLLTLVTWWWFFILHQVIPGYPGQSSTTTQISFRQNTLCTRFSLRDFLIPTLIMSSVLGYKFPLTAILRVKLKPLCYYKMPLQQFLNIFQQTCLTLKTIFLLMLHKYYMNRFSFTHISRSIRPSNPSRSLKVLPFPSLNLFCVFLILQH